MKLLIVLVLIIIAAVQASLYYSQVKKLNLLRKLEREGNDNE